MLVETIWLKNGNLYPVDDNQVIKECDDLYGRQALVRLTVEDDLVTVKWSMFAANWSSLFFAMDWLAGRKGTIKLEYFLSGWFAETIESDLEARERIGQLISKSDIHLPSRTFIKEVDPGKVEITNIIKNTLEEGSASPDYSVDMVFDESSGRYVLERIGPKSCIANLFGLSPVSYPCLSGHSYDQVVSQAYEHVIRKGGLHYDHIVAAMNTPDKSVVWYPYQRLVMPHRFPDGRNGVSVVAELGNVNINVV